MVEGVDDYEEKDFIDAKDNQGDWRVGYVVTKYPTSFSFKVRFDGWDDKYDEVFKFSSSKLLPFRAKVIGYTGQKSYSAHRISWKFDLNAHHIVCIANPETSSDALVL